MKCFQLNKAKQSSKQKQFLFNQKHSAKSGKPSSAYVLFSKASSAIRFKAFPVKLKYLGEFPISSKKINRLLRLHCGQIIYNPKASPGEEKCRSLASHPLKLYITARGGLESTILAVQVTPIFAYLSSSTLTLWCMTCCRICSIVDSESASDVPDVLLLSFPVEPAEAVLRFIMFMSVVATAAC